MTEKDWNAPDCDDQLPLISGIGHDSVREVIIHSSVGQCAIDELPILSTIGRGPVGATGPVGPQGLTGADGVDGGSLSTAELDAMMDARIVLVPNVDWPPADPVNGVLYLRAAL